MYKISKRSQVSEITGCELQYVCVHAANGGEITYSSRKIIHMPSSLAMPEHSWQTLLSEKTCSVTESKNENKHNRHKND